MQNSSVSPSAELRHLAAFARVHRRFGGRVWIAEHVVLVDARISVGLELLVDDARRDDEAFGGLEAECESAAGARATVHVFADGATRIVRVDETRELAVVAHDPHRGLLADRHVECAPQIAADLAVRDAREREIG